jgi:hypothetical protein
MSWPRKDDGLRLYFVRKGKSYDLVDTKAMSPSGNYECVGEVLVDNDPATPMLATSSCSPGYLYGHCRRAAWEDMPRVWRKALRTWVAGTLKSHRGLHRMGVA